MGLHYSLAKGARIRMAVYSDLLPTGFAEEPRQRRPTQRFRVGVFLQIFCTFNGDFFRFRS